MYCFEGADLPAGASLADVALQTDTQPADSGRLASLAGVPGVSADGVVRNLDGWSEIEYSDLRERPRDGVGAPTQLLAIPYFTWANRDTGAMRVWLPKSD